MDGPSSISVSGTSHRSHGSSNSSNHYGSSVPVSGRDNSHVNQRLKVRAARDRKAAKQRGIFDLVGTAQVGSATAKMLLAVRNDQVKNYDCTPLQRQHCAPSVYSSEIYAESCKWDERKSAFLKFYDDLTAKRGPAGQVCPNLFSKKVTGTVVTFSRAGMDDVTVEATRDDLPFSVSFNPKEKSVH